MSNIDDVDKVVKLDRTTVRAAEARLAADKSSRADGREAAVIAQAKKPGFMSWKN